MTESIEHPSDIKSIFLELAAKWSKETSHLSIGRSEDTSYQAIINLGEAVVPYILEEYDQPTISSEPEHWAYALAAITGENPIVNENRGKVAEMRHAWLEWGKAKGLHSSEELQ